MSNILSYNPIKISVIHPKTNIVTKTIIFVGSVPDKIKSELIKIEKAKTPNALILKNYYGKGWARRLYYKKTTGGTIKLVNENVKKELDLTDIDLTNADDDASDLDLDVSNDDADDADDANAANAADDNANANAADNADDAANAADNADTDNADNVDNAEDGEGNVDNVNKPEVDDFNFDMENDNNKNEKNDNDINIVKIEDLLFKKDKPLPEHKVDKNSKIMYSFINIYPEDNILEFKKKILLATDIPIYRQHLWVDIKNRAFPLCYNINFYDINVSVNMTNLIDTLGNDSSGIKTTTVEGLPIDNKFYARKNFIKVEANDTFKTIHEYYFKYGIAEYNLVDLDTFYDNKEQLFNQLKNDRYQLELVYYGFIIKYFPIITLQVFVKYIQNENTLIDYYPNIEFIKDNLYNQIQMESNIMTEKNNLTNKDKNNIKKKIKHSITSSHILVSDSLYSTESVIYIRNLFSQFELSKKVNMCKCHLLHSGKHIILHKTYENAHEFPDKIPLNSIVFRIKIDKHTTESIYLVVFKNGNYIIKSKWREDSYVDFNKIYNICDKHITPVISQINNYNSLVLYDNMKLTKLTKNNSKFTEINISTFYYTNLTDVHFNIMKKQIDDYHTAGIWVKYVNELNSQEFYFNKGMYQFDIKRIENQLNINNYYDHLSNGPVNQKWDFLFKKTRVTKLTRRYSDIKIDITGLKEHEFNIYYDLILTFFYLYEKRCASNKDIFNNLYKNNNQISKISSKLKEQDSVLYDFKKLYKSNIVYSKICQKPYQPVILNKLEYNKLEKEKKKNAIKFWNFTTEKEVYYSCPNKKYPYIKFITKKHPLDYCIPCCKKMDIPKQPDDSKRIIHEACLKDYKYEKDIGTLKNKSRYIMTYGKDIDLGRLSKLPDNTLEALFYDIYTPSNANINSTNAGNNIDQECFDRYGYYLYGVEQNLPNISNIGFLHCIINILETNVDNFIELVLKNIFENKKKMHILLDGDISKYFSDIDEFANAVENIFLNHKTLVDENLIKIPWNEIFISFVSIYMDITPIIFDDKDGSDVLIRLPKKINNVDDYITSKKKNILILKKRKRYYPIYYIDTDIFFQTHLIENKIYQSNNDIIIILSEVIKSYLNNNNDTSGYSVVKNHIDLSIIKNMVNDKKLLYKIEAYFINYSNTCYAVLIQDLRSSLKYYIPIFTSYYSSEEGINLLFNTKNIENYIVSLTHLNKFIADFNHWVALESMKNNMIKPNVSEKLSLEERVQPIYPYITITNWLLLKDKIIGFISENLNWYINPIEVKDAFKVKKVKLIKLLYNPTFVNDLILNKKDISKDKRCQNIGRSLYNSHLYQLLLLELLTFINKYRNESLRKLIKTQIIKTDFNKSLDVLFEILENKITEQNDFKKLKNQISKFMIVHHDKKKLLLDIDSSRYVFDDILLIKLRKLPLNKLIIELHRIFKNLVVYGSIDKVKDFEFPNMFSSCQKVDQSFCNKKKIIIEKQKLKDMLDVMGADILNPIKEKFLFGTLLVDHVVQFFKFIKRPHEKITVNVIDV